jgi:hypothetical protein
LAGSSRSANTPRLFIDHPHFSIFPGEGGEVMAIMPVPTL